MVRAYRVRGHLFAQIDPLGLPPKGNVADLEPGYFGLKDADLDRTVSGITIQGPDSLTLRQVLERMHNTYCRSVGVQYMHIDSPEVRSWLAARMEGSENRITLSREQQLDILTRLTDAVIFEEFIQKKYLGAKSFSLEGSESLIPLLDLAIEKAGEQKIDEIVLGMAHRGRLNVLANIMGKSPRDIFREFEDSDPQLHLGRGDVKYHLGYSSRLDGGQRPQAPPLPLLQPQPSGVREPGGPWAACAPSRIAPGTTRANRAWPCSSTATPPSRAKASSRKS